MAIYTRGEAVAAAIREARRDDLPRYIQATRYGYHIATSIIDRSKGATLVVPSGLTMTLEPDGHVETR